MNEIDSEKLYEFKKLIRQLKEYRGSGTQLVSVYIPAGYPIPEISAKIREEINQASNIKSKQTRTNVIAALERILAALKHFKKTPPNGLVIFAGNVSQDPSREDIRTFVVEPIYELRQSIYRCDSTFLTEPLERMLSARDSYGILVMDGREATLAILRGTATHIIRKINNTAHAKVRKGGQSARRYERLIEEATEKYYKRIGEAMDEIFLGKVKGIIVGGPGPSKEFFLDAKPFNYQHKILGIVNTGYTDEYGVREVIEAAKDIIANQEAVKEKRLVEKFIKTVVKGGKATYGLNEVIQAIKSNRAELVLVSEDSPYIYLRFKCNSCGNIDEEIVEKNNLKEQKECPKCHSPMYLEERMPITEYIIELAKEHGTKVEVISSSTAEGAQFLQGFGGLGAFLRY